MHCTTEMTGVDSQRPEFTQGIANSHKTLQILKEQDVRKEYLHCLSLGAEHCILGGWSESV